MFKTTLFLSEVGHGYQYLVMHGSVYHDVRLVRVDHTYTCLDYICQCVISWRIKIPSSSSRHNRLVGVKSKNKFISNSFRVGFKLIIQSIK